MLAPPLPIVAVRVHGRPAPQGSKNTNRHGAVYESSKHVKPWREAVKAAVLDVRPFTGLIDYPVTVRLTFILDRPKGHYGTGRNAGTLRPGAPAVPGYKPDLDKLIRSTLDALKDAYVYRDDSRIVRIDACKVYASPERGGPGAEVDVWDWRPER